MIRVPSRQHSRIAEYAKAYGLPITRVLDYCIEKGLVDIEQNHISLSPIHGQHTALSKPEDRIDVILALNALDFEKFCGTIPEDTADEYFRMRTNLQREKGGLKPLPPGWKVGDTEPGELNDEAAFLAAEAAVAASGDPYDESK